MITTKYFSSSYEFLINLPPLQSWKHIAATGYSLGYLKWRTWSINSHFEVYYTTPLASSLCSSCSTLFPEPFPLVTGHRHSIKRVPTAGHQYSNENNSLASFLHCIPKWSRPKYFAWKTEWHGVISIWKGRVQGLLDLIMSHTSHFNQIYASSVFTEIADSLNLPHE